MTERTRFRRYNLLLIGLAYAAIVGFGLYGRHFEPLTGDLTRIGWFSENEFGWTLPQQRFVPPPAPAATLDGSYDIIAVGDSFTAEEYNPGTAWPHVLARDTGLRVGVFDSGIDSARSRARQPGLSRPSAGGADLRDRRALVRSGTPRRRRELRRHTRHAETRADDRAARHCGAERQPADGAPVERLAGELCDELCAAERAALVARP